MEAKLNNIIEVMNYSIGKIWNRLCNNSSLKFEIKAKQFYAASQRVL